MFVDYTKIKVKAGDGGNGAITFHREKYVMEDQMVEMAETVVVSFSEFIQE